MLGSGGLHLPQGHERYPEALACPGVQRTAPTLTLPGRPGVIMGWSLEELKCPAAESWVWSQPSRL